MAKSSLYNKVLEIKNIKDTTITPYNLRSGINAYGIVGNYTNGANITSSDVSQGKVGYANGSTIVGNLREFTNETINIPMTYSADKTNNKFVGTYYSSTYITENNKPTRLGEGIIRNQSTTEIKYNTISQLLNIQPMDIKKDKTILDITGQYDASTEFSGVKMDPVKPSSTPVPLTASITEVSGLDMIEGTTLNNFFANLPRLVTVSNINTPNVTSLSYFFYNCTNLKYVKSANFYNISKTSTINCYNMFCYDRNLLTIDNTVRFPNRIDGNYMFYGCSNLVDINTPLNISSAWGAFDECVNLRYINQPINLLSGVCSNLFQNCRNLVDVSNVKFSSNSNLVRTFSNCGNVDFNTLNLLKVEVNSAYQAFYNCPQFKTSDMLNVINQVTAFRFSYGTFAYTGVDRVLTKNDLGSTRIMLDEVSSMYAGTQITSVNLDELNYLSSSNANYLFSSCKNLKTITGNFGLKVSACGIVYGCTNLKTADIEVNTYYNGFNYMFANCTNLTDVTIRPNSNMRSDYHMDSMFNNCTNLVNLNLPDWMFTRKFTYFKQAFKGCSNLRIANDVNFVVNGCLWEAFADCGAIADNLHLEYYQNANTSSYGNNCNGSFRNAGMRNISMDFYSINNLNYCNTYFMVQNAQNLKTFSINFYGSNNNGKIAICSCVNNCKNLSSVSYNINSGLMNFSTSYAISSSNITNSVVIDFQSHTVKNIGLYHMVWNTNVSTIEIRNIDTSNVQTMGMWDMINISNVQNIIFNTNIPANIYSLSINGCPNLTDNTIDNILGIMATTNILNISNYYKNGVPIINSIFPLCGISADRFNSLTNTAKLVAKGWSVV